MCLITIDVNLAPISLIRLRGCNLPLLGKQFSKGCACGAGICGGELHIASHRPCSGWRGALGPDVMGEAAPGYCSRKSKDARPDLHLRRR